MSDDAPLPAIPADQASAQQAVTDLRTPGHPVAAAYLRGDAQAVRWVNEAHRIAHPDTDNGAPAPAAGTPEEAMAAIERLRGDPAFVKRVEGGDPTAKRELAALHERAYGEAAQTAADSAPLPFQFSPDLPPEAQSAARAAADDAIAATGVDRNEARSFIESVEQAIGERSNGGQPRAMDDVEMLQMSRVLYSEFGEEGSATHSAAMDRIEGSLKAMGPRAGEWLRQGLLHAGPGVAASTMVYLANLPPKGQQR